MEEKKYYIISLKHTAIDSENFVLWKPEFCGYTTDISKAGIYTEAEVRAHYGSCYPILEGYIQHVDGKLDSVLVPADDIAALEKLGLTVKRVLTYK